MWKLLNGLEVVQNKCVSYDFYKNAADRMIYMESFGFQCLLPVTKSAEIL